MTNHEHELVLQKLTEGMTAEDRSALAGAMSVRRFLDGDRLVEQGEWHDSLLVIGAGEVMVRLEARKGDVELDPIGPGDWIGEMEVLEPGPAPQAVEAREGGWLLQLPHEELEEFRILNPGLSGRLHMRLSESLASRLRRCDTGGLENGPSGPGVGDWLRTVVTGRAVQ